GAGPGRHRAARLLGFAEAAHLAVPVGRGRIGLRLAEAELRHPARRRTMSKRTSTAALGLLLALAGPAPADSPPVAMAGVAKGVAGTLKAFNQPAIRVAEFTGPPTLPATGGPAIAQTLAEELKKAGLDVRPVAPVAVAGSFENVIDAASGELSAKITGKVV